MAEGSENFSISLFLDNSQVRNAAKETAEIFQGIGKDAERSGNSMDAAFGNGATNVRKSFDDLSERAKATANSVESAFKRAGAAIGIAFSIDRIKGFAQEAINVRGNMESLETSFETLLGSAEKGRQLFQQLRDFGVHTPLELPDLAKNAQTLLGFGIQAKDVMGILKDIGNISMGDKTKMEGLTLAFAQATSTGHLMGQDLLQMINAGFNPLETMAQQTGKSIGELKDEMSKGTISADMLRQAFAAAAGQGGKFDNMLEKQSKTINGMRSNLNDAIEMAYNDIGQKLEPAVIEGIDLAQQMVEHWQQIGKAIIDIVAGFGTYKAAMMTISALNNAAINQQIAGYQALLPAKEQSIDADLQAAVASGRYSSAKAAELQALRNEIAAKIESMQASLKEASIEVAAARASYQAATRSLVVARQKQEVAQSQVAIALRSGNAEEIAAAKTAAATAKKEVQTAAIARNSASRTLNTATTQRNAIATELDTLQTNANSVAKRTAVTATTLLTLATKGLTAAWQSMKLAFMSNPIGAVITIALTAITTFMTLKDLFADTGTEVQKQASIAEQTAQSFKQKVGDAIDDEIAKVTKLKSTIHDSNATYAQRKQAIAEMQKIVPGYHASISREGKLFEENVSAIDNYIKKLQKAAMAEAAYQLQIENNKKILKLQGIAEDAGNKASATMRNFQKRTGVGLYENEGVSSSVQDQQETERGWVDKFLNRQNSTNRQIAEIQRENAKYARIERENGGHSTSNENILQRVKQHNQPRGGSATPKAGKAGKGGHTGTGSTVDYATKQEEEEHKQALQQAKQAKDDAYAIEQAAIDGMDEGEAKKLRQAALNHQKEKDQLDEQERELYEQKVEHAKALWEADPKSKGSGFWSTHTRDKKTGLVSGIAPLTDEETSGIDAQRKSEDIRYGNEVQQILQQSMDSLIEYYKNFGTLEEQRYAIAKDYDEKIAKATTEGEKKSLEAQKQRDLATAGANSLANDIDWSHTFEGIGNVLGDIARQTLEKVEKYMNTDEFKRQKPSEQKAYIDLRDKLQQETGGQMTSPFNFGQWGRIAKQVKDYQQSVRTLQEKTKAHSDAVKELQDAEKRLKNANTDMAKTIEQNNVDVARDKVNVTGEQVEAARSDTQKKQQQLNDSTTKAANGLNNFAAALQQMNSGSLHDFANGVTKLITGLVGGSKSVGKSLEELGGKIGGIIGAILQILDALGDDPKGFINDLFERITTAVETILSDLPDLVGSIIKDVGTLGGSIIEGFGEMFGAKEGWLYGSNAKEVKKITEELTKSNDALKTSIDSLKETIENENGINTITDTQKALQAQKKVNENQMSILEAQMGYHSHHHSNAYYWGLGDNDYAQINRVLADYASRHPEAQTTTNSVYSLGDIYKLTPEQMNEIRTNLADVWTSMLEQGKYDKSEYWTAYADLAGKTDEITNTLREKLTGITFDSMHDDFVDKLMDMENKASDFTKDVNKQFAKGLLNFAIGTKLDSRLKQWWQNWADTMEQQSGNLTESQINNMRTEYEAFVSEGMQIRDRVFKVTGYDKDSYSQDSSKSVLEGVTQDQVEELNGRMTSVQINLDKIAQQIQEDYKQNGTMLATVQDIRSIMDDLLDLQNDQIGHLQKIETYTSELPGMSEKLEKIRKSVEHL